MCRTVHCKKSAANCLSAQYHLYCADKRRVIVECKLHVSECLGDSCAEEIWKAVVVGYFAVGLLFQQVPGQTGECYRGVTINWSLSKIRTLDLRTRISSGSHFTALLRRYISRMSLYFVKQEQLVSNPPQFVSDNIVYCSADCSDWSHHVMEVR